MSEAYAILMWTQRPHVGTVVENHVGSAPTSTGGKAMQDLVGAWWDSYLQTC